MKRTYNIVEIHEFWKFWNNRPVPLTAKRTYSSDHLQRQLDLARAWLAQSRVPVSVRCGMAERLFLASQERHRE